jgi:hypothetical protein
VTKDAANFVSNLWVDYALFRNRDQQAARDSTSAAKALWPEWRARDPALARLDRRAAGSPRPRRSTAYNSNDLRIFSTSWSAPQAVKPTRRPPPRKAEATLARLKGGADFGQVALEVSDDPGSKMDGGFLPPGPRGRFVPTFDSAAWKLAPGAMTGLVESPFGYHIIKRPAEAAVAPRLAAYLGQLNSGKADSTYMEALGKANQLDIAKSAPADMKAAALDPEASKGSSKRLTSFKNGELTVGEYIRWVRALPPQYNAQLKQANDTVLAQFAKVLSLNLLLLRQADSAKVGLTGAEWKSLYDVQWRLESLKSTWAWPGRIQPGTRSKR